MVGGNGDDEEEGNAETFVWDATESQQWNVVVAPPVGGEDIRTGLGAFGEGSIVNYQHEMLTSFTVSAVLFDRCGQTIR